MVVESLRFDKYPNLLALKAVKHLLSPDMTVTVHEKPRGIPFRIMFNDGNLTFGSESRKVGKNNPKYQKCFEILDDIGLDRMQLSPLRKYLVHGYFVGVGEGAERYTHKTFYPIDVQNPHGKFMDFGQFTKFVDIIGLTPIPTAYHDSYNVNRIYNLITTSRLTADSKPTGFIMKLDPPAQIELKSGDRQYCMVDLSRDTANVAELSEKMIIDEFIQTICDMPLTATILMKVSRPLPPNLNKADWQSSVVPPFLQMFGERGEDTLFYYMERLLEIKEFQAYPANKLRKYVENQIIARFDKIGGDAYARYTQG